MSTRLIAVSPEVRDDLVALKVARPEKFLVIRLGIELDERVELDEALRAETRRVLGIAPERFVVGWIGRMTSIKNTDVVLRAFGALRERGIDAVLCLIGDGPDRNGLEHAAHDLALMRHCLFLGYQEDVARFYCAFDCFLLASENEGTPVTIIESLAAGRPVVATRVGGVPDVVEDGVDGFLAEPHDVDGLAERLERLARDPVLRAEMGRRGRERALSRYAVDRLVADVDALYRSLLPGLTADPF